MWPRCEDAAKCRGNQYQLFTWYEWFIWMVRICVFYTNAMVKWSKSALSVRYITGSILVSTTSLIFLIVMTTNTSQAPKTWRQHQGVAFMFLEVLSKVCCWFLVRWVFWKCAVSSWELVWVLLYCVRWKQLPLRSCLFAVRRHLIHTAGEGRIYIYTWH